MFTKNILWLWICLALALGWATQDGFSGGLDGLWRRGKFAEAREIVEANLQSGNIAPSFLWDAARAMEETRDYTVAAGLYEAAGLTAGSDYGLLRKAKEREYHCRWLAGNYDPQAEWIATGREAIAALTAGSVRVAGDKHKLSLELGYLLEHTVDTDAVLPAELAEGYPDSDVVLRAAKEKADEISLMRNSDERLQKIESFMDLFPENYWRHVVYRYSLHNAWVSRTGGALDAVATAYLEEYPGHPESLGVVSRYFFEADVNFEDGLKYARRSVELYETLLGLDGSAGSLGRVQDETRNIPTQPDHHLPSLRVRFNNYLGSRFNLGRYLVADGQYQAALGLVAPVIELNPYTVNEAQTTAPFCLVAGEAELGLEHYEGAYRFFLQAVVLGDSQNRYSLQAQQQLDKLEEEQQFASFDEIRRGLFPAGLRGVSLPSFVDVTTEMGLNGLEHRRIAWGDIDNDGDPDLLLDGHVLMGNDKGLRFGNATRGWKIIGPATGGLFADYDNDGDLDIYAVAGAGDKDRLWRNEGTHFVDMTALAGNPTDGLASEAAAWLDYDNDGWLDLYVANYGHAANGADANAADVLYHNTGRLFEKADAGSLGLATPFGEYQSGRGVCSADYDNDGDPDLFVGNYRLQENLLWENNAGVFTNAGRLHNLAGFSNQGWWGHTIGSAWGDVDNDGDLDLFCANLVNPRFAYFSDSSMLLINGGAASQPRFRNERESWGVKFEATHAEPAFFDANNDGYLDLYITSAYPNRRSFLYLNNGRGKFVDVTYIAGVRAFDGQSCAWADYDNDGDLDLAVGSASGMRLFRNDTQQSQGNGTNWLKVECVGSQTRESILGTIFSNPNADKANLAPLSNKSAIGTRVTVTAGGVTQIREIQSGKGSCTGNQLLAHFGLGSYSGELTLEVRFPSGTVVTKTIPNPNMRVVIQETIPVALPHDAAPVPADPGTQSTNQGDDAGNGADEVQPGSREIPDRG